GSIRLRIFFSVLVTQMAPSPLAAVKEPGLTLTLPTMLFLVGSIWTTVPCLSAGAIRRSVQLPFLPHYWRRLPQCLPPPCSSLRHQHGRPHSTAPGHCQTQDRARNKVPCQPL